MRPMMSLALLATLSTAPLALEAHGAVPPGAVPIDLQDCRYIEVVVKVPAASVDPLVPDDFQLIVGADGMNSILLSGASCNRATSGALQGSGSFTSFLARIQTPEDETLAGSVGVFFYRLEHYVGAGDVYRQVADAAGVDRVPVAALAVDGEPVLSTITIQDADLDLRVLAPATPDLPTGAEGGAGIGWREFHDVGEGYAVLEASLVGGPGYGTTAALVTASEGSLWAGLAGPVSAGPATYGHHLSVRDGWMAILPKPS